MCGFICVCVAMVCVLVSINGDDDDVVNEGVCGGEERVAILSKGFLYAI